jgi:septal ring factor EnvC (AmiA/AmiB activator)
MKKGSVMRFLLSTGVILVFALANVGCDKIKPPQPGLQAPPAASGSPVIKPGDQETFAQNAQKELDQMAVAIAELRTKVDAANATTKAKLSEELDRLEVDFKETQARLIEAKSATASSWEQLKEALAKSLDKLRSGMASLRKSSS